MSKHKIFFYPLQEDKDIDEITTFLFQSGDIGNSRSAYGALASTRNFMVKSASKPELRYSTVFINGNSLRSDFIIAKRLYTKTEFQELKELESAYNNREE